ncbi:hypothetical protein FRC07_014245, partial [Ceratobasidium sp. 392]
MPELIANLRKVMHMSCTACAPIFAVVDPTTEDTFFVNSQLLARRLNEESSSEDKLFSTSRMNSILESTTLIFLDEPPVELRSLPEPLYPQLAYLHEKLPWLSTGLLSIPSLPEVISLPSGNSSPHVQVPLAGILLNYPIAYVPPSQPTSQDNHSYLNGHALDVFDIRLQSSQTGDS